jgi:hypothetical protein
MKTMTDKRKRICLSMLGNGFGSHDVAVALARMNGYADHPRLSAVAMDFLPAVQSYISRLRKRGTLAQVLGLAKLEKKSTTMKEHKQ